MAGTVRIAAFGRAGALAIALLSGNFLLGCGPTGGVTPDAALDATAGGEGGADGASDTDAAAMFDAGRDGARGDAGRSDALASGDAPAVDTGMCGDAVRTCICACGANATCQQGCVNGDEDCSFCVLDAASMCCPMESMAFFDCLDRTGCGDQACINMMCGREQSAFNVCVTRRQTGDPACVSHVRVCLGADFPSIQCP